MPDNAMSCDLKPAATSPELRGSTGLSALFVAPAVPGVVKIYPLLRKKYML